MNGVVSGESGVVSVGVGVRPGVTEAEVYEGVCEVLRRAGLSRHAVAALATVEARAAEAGLLGAARRLGPAIRTYSPDALASVRVPNPSSAALRSTGTPSVAEAAALLAAGPGARLLVAKDTPAAPGRPARVTVAVAIAADGEASSLGPTHPDGPGRRTTPGDE